MTTANYQALIDQQNLQFVAGTFIGNRKQVAQLLCNLFVFEGGYRATYRAVKRGYKACDVYAGRMTNGRYGLNAL